MLKLLAVCLTLTAFSQDIERGLPLETEDLSRRWAVFNGRKLDVTVTPKNAKVGDMVKVKCTYIAPQDDYVIKILKKNGWDVEEVGKNAQIKGGFKETGRFKSTVDIISQKGEQETVVTLTISDVELEDSGKWGCEVPVGAPSYGASTRDFSQLIVTE